MKSIWVLAVAVAVVTGEFRFQTLTGSQGGALPIVARSDPCADNIFLNFYSSIPTSAANPRSCTLQNPRTTNSQTTFYGPALLSTGVNTGPGATMLLTFTGIGISALLPAGTQFTASLAEYGKSCETSSLLELERRAVTVTVAGNTATAVIPIDGIASNSWNLNIPGGIDMQLEEEPRDICFRLATYVTVPVVVAPPAPAVTLINAAGQVANTQWFYSGFRWKVARLCQTNANCIVNYVNPTGFLALNTLQQQIYISRSQCCGAVCINPNAQSCCSASTSRAIDRSTEKCCDVTRALTAFINAPCECYSNTGATSTTQPTCPSEESECCLPSKYSELFPTDCSTATPGTLCGNIRGQCYNPRTHRCCANGLRYDPGSQQCCRVTGLQSFDIPCPCSQDADCQGDNRAQFIGTATSYSYAPEGVSRQKCCQRSTPAPQAQAGCSSYVNYPSIASLSLTSVQCTGTCIDTRYQICCNGASCRREFERCCNTTCCNRFSGTCTSGRRSGAPRRFSNSREFRVPQDFCTTIEKLDEVRSFWIFILPTALLLATLGSLGFALVFANKAANRLFSFIEKLMIGISVFVILLGALLFFSPAYKYGIFIVLVGILAILTAAARVKWFNAFTTIAIVVLLFYIINPFDGNNYLTFNYLRLANGEPDSTSHGLFHLLTRMYPRLPNERNLCTDWYQGYFAFDPRRYSDLETNAANRSFAYCSRGFLTALLIVSAINLVLLVALFILSIFGLVLRFKAATWA